MARKKPTVIDHSWLFEKPIAHRGLHGDGVIENSITAYEAAIQKGYNIEIDVHILADGELVVFHDNTLERIFGEKIPLDDLTYDQLSKYTLPFVNEKIPTFKEVLDCIRGRTGLLIEIKTYVRTQVAARLHALLAEYEGNYAIQSFSPAALLWYRRHAPTVPVGILASDVNTFGTYWTGSIRPDFISYQVTDLNINRALILRARTPRLLAWTVNNPILERRARLFADNIIFERYPADPEARSHVEIELPKYI